MDSDAARNNNPNTMNTEYDGNRTVSSSPATAETATTISTIILQSHPIQIVVGLLQSKNTLNVKIVEISPKLNFLGATIEETVELQIEHDAVYKKLQNQKTPIDEFNVKAERLLTDRKAHPKVLEAMGQSLAVAWNDLLRIFDQRRHVLNVNANFHEKIGICLGKMSALEVSCRDTMLPNEIEAIQEFLNKFKQLRIEVLASVMVALKEGNVLLALLRETAMGGQCDSRPDSIKVEIKKSVSQVELWLEELHDRRNDLEQAWQKRKVQLEHCLAISMLIRDIYDLEQQLSVYKEKFDNRNHKLDSEANVSNALSEVIELKQDAVAIRDRALKITRSTEKLSINNRFEGGSNKAYMFLHECTEFVEELDNYEELLNRIKEFFGKSDRTLTELRRLESETVNLFKDRSIEKYSLTRLINDIAVLVDEPLRLGHALLDRVGRSNAEAFEIEKAVVEIENRRIYLEEFYTQNNFEYMRITETLNEFYELCKSLSVWLISVNKTFLIKNNSMGNSLNEGKHFLQLHHQLLSDLEIKGTEINSLLANTSPILESIEQMERNEVDKRVQSLRDTWKRLRTIVENRVDLSTNFVKFLQLAEKLAEMFKYVEQIVQSAPDDTKLSQLDELWMKIKSAYSQLKDDGNSFLEHISMVVDDTLDVRATRKCVEQILMDFSSRQITITESWDNWTTIIQERREIECVLQQIMSKNELLLISASKLDAQLYPILMKDTTDLKALKEFLYDKLHLFLVDIEKAQIEITHHIQTTAALKPKDDKTIDKVTQVLRNLNAIVNKLASIKNEFHSLIDGIVDYLENLITTKNAIEIHFNQMPLGAKNLNGIERTLADNEQFGQKIRIEINRLAEHQARLVEQINKQEPNETKEHDVQYVKGLLCAIQELFETNNAAFMNQLKRDHDIHKFKFDIKTIFDEIDHLKNRMNGAHEQLKEALITGCTGLLKCESFEQPIQHLDQRIDGFINASENVCNNNNEAAPFIQNSIGNLKRYWNDVKRQSNDLMQSIEHCKRYSSVNEQIDRYYCEHRNYLETITNQINMAKHPNEATELINRIDQYISNNESRQLELLKDLATLSKNVYGFDKTIEKYSENIELFQSFFTTKYQLNTIYEQLIEEEKIQIENEKFAATLPQVKMIQTEQRLSTDEPIAYVQQQQMHQHQNIDMKIIESKQKYVMEEPPRFVEQLSNVQIQQGERCMLMCKIYSSQPINEVLWFRNGLPISGNNKQYLARYDNSLCTLSIDEKYTDDKSVAFTCRVSNHLGTDETTAYLTILKSEPTEVLFPPKFREILTNLNTKTGSSITWKCFVEGNPLPTIQWYKNDVCIDILPQYNFTYNNGEAILRMDDLNNNDAGLFTCVAKNMLGVDQCSASLIVADVLQSIDSHTTNAESDVIEQKSGRPAFRAPLVDLNINVGQPIELTCDLIGDPQPSVIWKLNGHEFFSSDRIILKQSSERVWLLIKEAQTFDTGTYTLCAKNNAGLAYTSCDVTVNNLSAIDRNFDIAIDSTAIKPTVTLPLQNVCAIEGKSIQLDCEIRGFPEPEVIWYHENKPIKESSDVQLLFRGDRCSLLIQEAFMEDMGKYKVVAINSAGETSSKCDLTVIPNSEAEPAKRSVEITKASNDTKTEATIVDGFEPKFEKLLSDVLVNEGDTIELDCIVHCKPLPVIKWFLSNNQIEENDRIRFVYNEENGNAKLIFNNVANEDKGVYTIYVSNKFGEAKCFSHLNVKSVNAAENIAVKVNEDEEKNHFLHFKERFTNRAAHVGDTVKFECIVVGKPTPKIRWFFNDRPVQGKNFLPSISGERQVLTIPATTSETFGKISCLAENEFGRDVCDAVLTIADPLPQSAERSEEYTEEYNTGSSNVTIKKQSAITTKTSEIRSYQTKNGVPIILKSIEQPIDSSMDSGTSHLTETKKNTLAQSNFTQSTDNIIVKSQKKNSAPRFISPLVGKIAKQGSSTTLEAVIDGFPTPDIVLLKNDLPLVENDNLKVSRQQNRIFITLENISIPDAGRYSCSATNSMGNAVSTADVVVKKTMFPPVFGHRLQAKVAKLGERVVMDIEVSGIPDPIVTWHKDDKPLLEAIISKHKIQNIGNSHTLIIEKACNQDAGKYMVKAVNDAGETQSIADFIILEPTPDGMIEIVKTVATENIEGQRMADETNTAAIIPKSYHSSQSENIAQSDSHGTTEQMIHTETRRVIETTMRMEHKSPHPDIEIQYSPRPNQSNDIFKTETECTYQLNPVQPPPKQDYTTQNYIIESKPSKTITGPHNVINESVTQNGINHIESYEFEKKEFKSFSGVPDGAKPFENIRKDVVISNGIKPFELAPSKKVIENGELSYYEASSARNTPILHKVHPPVENGYQYETFKPNAIQETIQRMAHTIEGYERVKVPESNDLKAPSLVKFATPIAKPYTNGHSIGNGNNLNIQPGEPPEICFAPRLATEEKFSMVQQIEKSLEKDLEKGPSKVLPHSVRIVPPSPKYVASEMFGTTTRSISKQSKQYELNPSKNHASNNTFHYEYTKPVPVQNHQLNTRNDLSPIKSFEKNQFTSSTSSKVSFNTESSYSMVDGVVPSPVHRSSPIHRPSSVKFKESETEAKVKPIWRPSYESDSDVPHYKPIKPNLTPTGRSSTYSVGASPIPLNEKPLKFSSTSEQFHERDYQVLKPKPLSAFSNHKVNPPYGNPTQYYTATAGPPYHNQKNVSSETSRHMEMRESTELSSQHIVNMSSTKRIVQYDHSQQQQQHHEHQEHHYQSQQNDSFEKQLEALPFKVSPNVSNIRHKIVPAPPTPTKFKPGDCRESDYDSEIESFRIRSVWTPNQTESESKPFRHVSAPTPNRCASATKHNNFQRILTPMDFDSGPVELPTKIQTLSTPSPCFNSSPNQFKTQTLDRFRSKKKSSSYLKSTSQDDLSIVNSTTKYSRLQSPSLAFNEQKKSTEYGTKSIDTNSGLIYFKYDFGYEFGIIFPGEGRKYIAGGNKISSSPSKHMFHNSAGIIDIPVSHENTIKRNLMARRDPNAFKRTNFFNEQSAIDKQSSISFNVDELQGEPQWTHDKQPIYKEYVRDVATPQRANYSIIGTSPSQERLPKYAPIFIAPLKDIAVINGHTARFECIVQCDPHPFVEWYRNDEPIRNGYGKHMVEFRNGVCRLTIPETVLSDSGIYSCTGTNHIGSVVTSAELVVNTENWGLRKQ